MGGCCLMFHLLFVPRYLDYVQTDFGGGGGYLGLSPSCLEGLFHFTACLRRPHFLSLTLFLQHTPILLFLCHSHPSHPSCDILSQA